MDNAPCFVAKNGAQFASIEAHIVEKLEALLHMREPLDRSRDVLCLGDLNHARNDY